MTSDDRGTVHIVPPKGRPTLPRERGKGPRTARNPRRRHPGARCTLRTTASDSASVPSESDEDRASLPNVVDALVAKSPSEGPRRRHRLTFTPSEATPVATTKTETPGVSLSCCR